MTPFSSRVAFIVFVCGLGIAIYLLAVMTRRGNSASISTADDFSRDTEYILFGASLIDAGVNYLPDWKVSMMREFDRIGKRLLEQYYEASRQVATLPEHARAEAAAHQVIVR